MGNHHAPSISPRIKASKSRVERHLGPPGGERSNGKGATQCDERCGAAWEGVNPCTVSEETPKASASGGKTEDP